MLFPEPPQPDIPFPFDPEPEDDEEWLKNHKIKVFKYIKFVITFVINLVYIVNYS